MTFKKIDIPSNLAVMTDGDSADIILYGMIGEDWFEPIENQNTDSNFLKTLRETESKYSKINIRINSPGGSMLHGNAIINAIKHSKAEITAYNDGVCASMAANIFLAAKKRVMATNALLMVHPPSSFAFGNAKDMRDTADLLDKFEETAIAVMAEATNIEKEKVKKDFFGGDDKWMTYEEVKALGVLSESQQYKSEGVPTDVSNMNYEQVLNHFSQKQDNKPDNPLKKIIQKMWGKEDKPSTEQIISQQIDEEMNIESIKSAIDTETINLEELKAVVDCACQEKAAKAAKNAEKIDEEEDVPMKKTENESDAMNKLLIGMQEISNRLSVLESKPGDTPSFGDLPADDVDNLGENDPLAIFNKAAIDGAEGGFRVIPKGF